MGSSITITETLLIGNNGCILRSWLEKTDYRKLIFCRWENENRNVRFGLTLITSEKEEELLESCVGMLDYFRIWK